MIDHDSSLPPTPTVVDSEGRVHKFQAPDLFSDPDLDNFHGLEPEATQSKRLGESTLFRLCLDLTNIGLKLDVCHSR